MNNRQSLFAVSAEQTQDPLDLIISSYNTLLDPEIVLLDSVSKCLKTNFVNIAHRHWLERFSQAVENKNSNTEVSHIIVEHFNRLPIQQMDDKNYLTILVKVFLNISPQYLEKINPEILSHLKVSLFFSDVQSMLESLLASFANFHKNIKESTYQLLDNCLFYLSQSQLSLLLDCLLVHHDSKAFAKIFFRCSDAEKNIYLNKILLMLQDIYISKRGYALDILGKIEDQIPQTAAPQIIEAALTVIKTNNKRGHVPETAALILLGKYLKSAPNSVPKWDSFSPEIQSSFAKAFRNIYNHIEDTLTITQRMKILNSLNPEFFDIQNYISTLSLKKHIMENELDVILEMVDIIPENLKLPIIISLNEELYLQSDKQLLPVIKKIYDSASNIVKNALEEELLTKKFKKTDREPFDYQVLLIYLIEWKFEPNEVIANLFILLDEIHENPVMVRSILSIGFLRHILLMTSLEKKNLAEKLFLIIDDKSCNNSVTIILNRIFSGLELPLQEAISNKLITLLIDILDNPKIEKVSQHIVWLSYAFTNSDNKFLLESISAEVKSRLTLYLHNNVTWIINSYNVLMVGRAKKDMWPVISYLDQSTIPLMHLLENFQLLISPDNLLLIAESLFKFVSEGDGTGKLFIFKYLTDTVIHLPFEFQLQFLNFSLSVVNFRNGSTSDRFIWDYIYIPYAKNAAFTLIKNLSINIKNEINTFFATKIIDYLALSRPEALQEFLGMLESGDKYKNLKNYTLLKLHLVASNSRASASHKLIRDAMASEANINYFNFACDASLMNAIGDDKNNDLVGIVMKYIYLPDTSDPSLQEEDMNRFGA